MNAIIGFSINPEIIGVYDASRTDPKLPLEEFRIDLSGSSGDVALALQKLGGSPLLLGLTGPSTDIERVLLEHRIKTTEVLFTSLPILNKTSIAFLPIDGTKNCRVAGRRGNIIETLIPTALDIIRENGKDRDVWKIATGARSNETPFIKTLFEKSSGYRVLNPNRFLCRTDNRQTFDELLAITDFLILNEYEYADMGLKTITDIHCFGPRLIIVTEGDKGGSYSLRGETGYYHPITYSTDEYFTPGAGDWFLGGLIHHLSEKGVSIENLTENILLDALIFAARVAGKKVTMKGAGNGPSLDDL